jgi:DNA-binding response OmpR family regulator
MGDAANVPAVPVALVVADGSWVANAVRSALSLGSWQVEDTDDPHSITDRLEGADAVIVDMQVGTKGGMAVIRAIRQTTDAATRPRLILLLDRSADSFLARRAGADAAVLKPFDASELREALALQPALAGQEEE